MGAGLCWTGTNPGYTNYELQHHLKTSRTKLVIAQPDLYVEVFRAAKACGILERNVLTFDSQVQESLHPTSWHKLLQHGEEDWERFDDLSVAQSTPACILFSSGTTGLPKAALLSHYNLVAQHTLLQEQVSKPYRVSSLAY